MKDLVLAGFYRATPLLNVVCGNCFFHEVIQVTCTSMLFVEMMY